MFFLYLYYLVALVQAYFGIGTAYRLTKKGGDNGVALFGWNIVMGLASLIPGLGFYLWRKHREPQGGGYLYSPTRREER